MHQHIEYTHFRILCLLTLYPPLDQLNWAHRKIIRYAWYFPIDIQESTCKICPRLWGTTVAYRESGWYTKKNIKYSWKNKKKHKTARRYPAVYPWDMSLCIVSSTGIVHWTRYSRHMQSLFTHKLLYYPALYPFCQLLGVWLEFGDFCSVFLHCLHYRWWDDCISKPVHAKSTHAG